MVHKGPEHPEHVPYASLTLGMYGLNDLIGVIHLSLHDSNCVVMIGLMYLSESLTLIRRGFQCGTL